jgi:tetratricopeptide (TPR) repeat protein
MKLIFTLFFILMFGAVWGQSAKFQSIEKQINDQINKGQWDDVVMLSTDLLIEEPTKGDGYYYTAMAFYKLNDLEKAKVYIDKAGAFNDPLLKTKIDRLKAGVSNAAQARQSAANASAQEKSGNSVRAVDNWRQAWLADKTNVEFALNAVGLYVEEKNYPAALDLLNEPFLATDPEAIKLAKRINQTPQMVSINGYNAAMKEGKVSFDKDNFETALSKALSALTYRANDNAALKLKESAKDEIAYAKARKENTIGAFEKYKAEYPLGLNIASCDRILQNSYIATARDYIKEGKYPDGIGFYEKFITVYPRGEKVLTVKTELCDAYFNYAKSTEKSKYGGGIENSVTYYTKALECNHAGISLSKIHRLERKVQKLSYSDDGFFAWNADENNYIGFTTGTLNNRTLGFYIGGRTSPAFFETLSSWKTDDASSNADAPSKDNVYAGESKNRELYINLGLTFKVIRPLWVYAGPGVVFATEMKKFQAKGSSVTDWVENKDKTSTSFAPEAGVQLLLGPVTLRYGVSKSFQSKVQKDIVQTFGFGFSM